MLNQNANLPYKSERTPEAKTPNICPPMYTELAVDLETTLKLN